MILKCSAGHIIDTSKLSLSGSMYKKPNDKCGLLISYNVMDGSKFCQCKLKRTSEQTIARNKRIKNLIGKLPSELNGNQLRTLDMAIRKKLVRIDKFTEIIHKKGNWQ